jgi:hypothetical protein
MTAQNFVLKKCGNLVPLLLLLDQLSSGSAPRSSADLFGTRYFQATRAGKQGKLAGKQKFGSYPTLTIPRRGQQPRLAIHGR